MIRKASTGIFSAQNLKKDLGLPVGVRTIQQILSANPHLKYENDNRSHDDCPTP